MGQVIIHRGSGGGGGGGAALSAITAATAGNTIANAANAQVWQWALTADTIAMRHTESAASTAGTSTAGVPNQVLNRFDSIAASTASPMSVYSRGTHVFSVSPSATQLLGADGAANPMYSFASAPTSGFGIATGNLRIQVGGTNAVLISSNQFQVYAGSPTTPGLTEIASGGNSGLSWIDTTDLLVLTNSRENTRYISGITRKSQASASATGYALDVRKSRGTVTAPTVITTGDDLATISGWGYVGATNTYQEATRITHDTNGTISDVAGGLGGVLRFLTRLPAAVALVERFTLDNNETAAETAALISVAGAAATRVSVGAADSGGTGFRYLRVPN